ncbi:MAG: penicillin-binding transpeptidase domain-containing protein [Lachnospiraceae bacterium]|nr:penicillin-binding transpeptidase domain-containing protein [Lachnospiraceae bacterium]
MRKRQRIKAGFGRKAKLAFILFVLLAGFSSLGARVFYIKNVHGEEYETAAKTQQISRYDSIIAPNRGTITDRNNQALAVSTTVYNIVLDARVLVQNEEAEQEKTIKALSDTLEGVDYSTLKEYITIDPVTKKPKLDTSWKVLAKKQSREVKESLEAMGLKGVVYQKDTQRKYTSGTLASQVIGFIRDAMWGLEKQYNVYMSGVAGRSFITYDGVNGAVNQEIPAQDGDTIVTTLDYTIQTFAEEAVKQGMEEYNPENAAAIVMDPNTGEILAMAAGPSFDPNNPAEPLALDSEGFASMWENMDTKDQYKYLDGVWKNFNVSSTFEPGSIFKPMVVAAALEEGVIKNTDTFYCGGNKQVADRKINCNVRSGHGTLTVEQVLAYSCNVGMMDIADKMGPSMFYKYQRDFGFGSLTGVDLPSEVSASSLMYTEDRIKSTELATMSFGQSFNSTALQAINAMAAVINGGNLMRPYIVSQVVDKNGNVIKETKPEVIRKVISQETSDIVRKDLITTVEVGTGKKAKIQGYTIGGKTGTAQQGVRADDKYTVSFIGFLPADNPQYIAITLIHKPETYADGVTTVSPIMKALFEKIIKYKSIEPSYAIEEGKKSNEKNVIVNDYTNCTLFDVLTELEINNLNYELVGSGNNVVNQVPHGGAEVLEGSKVILYVEKGEGETGNVIVPTVKGLQYEEAVTALVDAGLEVVLKGDKTGIVTDVSPKSGVTVEEGTEVTITISAKEKEQQ